MRLLLAIRHPRPAAAHALCLLRGAYYRTLFRLLGKKVRIGRNVRGRGRLIVKGPGTVLIGDNVEFDGRGHPVTPFTHHPDAVIRIGNNVYLNGTRLGCGLRIEIDDHCILSDARITDTDFHGVHPRDRRTPTAVRSKPVFIGKNVWVGMAAIILKGVRVEENALIGSGAVITKDVPRDSVVAGNPARIVAHFESSDAAVLHRPQPAQQN